jgi:hypothetical protein
MLLQSTYPIVVVPQARLVACRDLDVRAFRVEVVQHIEPAPGYREPHA